MRGAHCDADSGRQIRRVETQIVQRLRAEAHGVCRGFEGIRLAAHMAPQPHREKKRREFERPIVEKSVHSIGSYWLLAFSCWLFLENCGGFD